MSEKVYSACGEVFNYDCALECAADHIGEKEESIVVYSADKVEYTISQFIYFPQIIEQIQDQASEELGEFSDGYLDGITPEQQAELKDEISKVVEAWADKHNFQPCFYKAVNIRERIITKQEIDDNE